jgi:glycosyltransferase involved in cell wall biosynthesis
MKILFLAPLPPPVNGHALAAKMFLEALVRRHDVAIVDLSVDSKGDGSVTPARLKAVLTVLLRIARRQRGAQAIYLTISESLFGNIKDLLIYCLCFGRLRTMYIHLHGGSIQVDLFDRFPFMRAINAWFIRRFAGIIISGESHSKIFAGMIDPAKVHVSVNFADDSMFVAPQAIDAKFAFIEPLRVLFISNMIPMKGYRELAEAWLSLPDESRRRLQLDFAGRFDTDANRASFVALIAGNPGIRYHGVVDDETKRRLFAEAHVFCLPTAFLEGQPISILEAYASGCVVLTTGQPGIRDVFTAGVNGFEVEPRSVSSIAMGLRALLERPADSLRTIATANCDSAEAFYRSSSYQSRLLTVVEGGRLP